MKNLTEEFCKEIIEKRGYFYIKLCKNGDNRTVTFKDNNGYYYETSWENFKSSKNFKPITQSNPYSIQNAKLYLINNNIPIELLSNIFISVSDKMEFKMSCGHIHKMSWAKMLHNSHYVCPKCCLSIRGNNHKVSEDKVKQVYEENGFILLEKYKTALNPLLCMDKNGYLGLIKYNDVRMGKKFNPFYFSNPYTMKNIEKWLNNNNINLKIISSEYINCDTPLEWECECGNHFYKCWDYIRSKKGLCCDSCFNKSNNENILKEYLLSLNIQYEREYKFKDCKNIRPLPFDFYIPNQNLCIEIDGEGHYFPVTFGGMSEKEAVINFEEQKDRDSIKTEYCKNNNIKLLRLSYLDFKTDEYKIKTNQWLK